VTGQYGNFPSCLKTSLTVDTSNLSCRENSTILKDLATTLIVPQRPALPCYRRRSCPRPFPSSRSAKHLLLHQLLHSTTAIFSTHQYPYIHPPDLNAFSAIKTTTVVMEDDIEAEAAMRATMGFSNFTTSGSKGRSETGRNGKKGKGNGGESYFALFNRCRLDARWRPEVSLVRHVHSNS
jgi:hypothetical protein